MEEAGRFTESGFSEQIAQRLRQLGLLVGIDVPSTTLGARLDLVAQTSRGQTIIVEVLTGKQNVADLFEFDVRLLDKYMAELQSKAAFIVVPSLDGDISRVPHVVDLNGLEHAVRGILTEEEATIGPPLAIGGGNPRAKVPTLFVAMPFEGRFFDTYEVGIREAAIVAGLVCERSDRQIFDGSIIKSIHKGIRRCVGLVADVTEANPNVMYELGYAKALKKTTVIISSTPPEQLPFDIRGYQIVPYEIGQAKRLQEALVSRFKHIMDKLPPSQE